MGAGGDVGESRAEVVSEHLPKGSLVYVEGRLQTREWQQDNQKRTTTEVVASNVQFLEPAPRKGSAAREAVAAGGIDTTDLPFE